MKNDTLTLQKLTLEDLTLLKEISRKTYSEAFSSENSIENMILYLDEAFNHETLLNELKEENTAFYFAKYNNQTIGYIKINRRAAQTEFKDDDAIELERIYIIKEYQGQGLGGQLLTKIIESAKQEKMNYLWLGVWDRNEKAIAFYITYGFKIFGSHEFRMGNEIQTDYLMKLML